MLVQEQILIICDKTEIILICGMCGLFLEVTHVVFDHRSLKIPEKPMKFLKWIFPRIFAGSKKILCLYPPHYSAVQLIDKHGITDYSMV